MQLREGVNKYVPFHIISVNRAEQLATRAKVPLLTAIDHISNKEIKRAMRMRSNGTVQLSAHFVSVSHETPGTNGSGIQTTGKQATPVMVR